MIVREARPADFDAVARVTVDAYDADGQLDGETGYETVLADVASRAEAGTLLVAVDETGQILGGVTFVLPGSPFAQLAGLDEAEFRMLAVDPAAQGRGVGEALVRECLRRAAAHGCSAVIISTRSFATSAQRLYQRLGFSRAPERDWSPMPGVDLLALRYELGRPDELSRLGRPDELSPPTQLPRPGPERPTVRLRGAGRR
jgi:ribosomal protein S18 acetylase RimI-like enzyme